MIKNLRMQGENEKSLALGVANRIAQDAIRKKAPRLLETLSE
jgi:hypothetical protein